jgi:hypothetical protein
MFYHPVSVREAVEKVNVTWFLPAIQRPYDWGERAKKESFISELFDSILREYPIGTMIIWETDKRVPYRRFLQDYDSEKLEKIVDKGLWERPDKLLVYDGQQRLQSLYSCLKFTFHGNVLCYDLLFMSGPEAERYGFKFFPKNGELELGYIRLNELYCCNPKKQAEFEEAILNRLKESKKDLNKNEELTAKKNLKQLWRLFVDEDVKLLSYYPLRINAEMDQIEDPLKAEAEQKEALNIFKRINTTGMILTNAEILFSEIKNKQFDFEEQVWDTNFDVKKQTNGFSFGPDNILQVLNVLVKGTIRIDPTRVKESDITEFATSWSKLKSPLKSFFYDFLYREFKFTHEQMIRSKPALIPLIAYFYWMEISGQKGFKDFSQRSMNCMKKYLIFSQLLDWGLQNYIDNFCRIVRTTCQETTSPDFPFEELLEYVKNARKKRETALSAYHFQYSPWFVLKIITPDTPFSFEQDPDERFNPEIDHIFPTTPENVPTPETKYNEFIWTVWNMQPIKGEINAYKLNKPPKSFFMEYPKYLKDYRFLPTLDPNDKIWLMENASIFIQTRKEQIITFLNQHYDLDIEPAHAYYSAVENAFHPIKGTTDEKIRTYDTLEIVRFLESKGIASDDQVIDGWTDEHTTLYEKALSK